MQQWCIDGGNRHIFTTPQMQFRVLVLCCCLATNNEIYRPAKYDMVMMISFHYNRKPILNPGYKWQQTPSFLLRCNPCGAWHSLYRGNLAIFAKRLYRDDFILRLWCNQHLEYIAVCTGYGQTVKVTTPKSPPTTFHGRIFIIFCIFWRYRHIRNIHRKIRHFSCRNSNQVQHKLQADTTYHWAVRSVRGLAHYTLHTANAFRKQQTKMLSSDMLLCVTKTKQQPNTFATV